MADIQIRKILFVQKFLSLKREETITKLENLLNTEMRTSKGIAFQPMTSEELNSRVTRSEKDFRAGRYKQGSELLKKYE